MTAAAKKIIAEPTATLEEFEGVCRDYASWWHDEILDKVTAVDCAQVHAELWCMVDAIGQDAIQAVMAEAFAPGPDLPSDLAAQLVKQWELADARDRWRHTGELPPGPTFEPPRPPPYETPQSTVDAFIWVARNEPPEYLARWLQEHPFDAPFLRKLWEERCISR